MTATPPILPIRLDPVRGRGATARLHRQLRDAILEGRLAAELALPASRVLARELGVARMTVVGVYDMLVAEGYAEPRRGAGTFVARLRRTSSPGSSLGAAQSPRSSSNPIRYDFRLGTPDTTLFPFEIWQRLSARGLRATAHRLTVHGDPAGEPELREAIATHVSFVRGVACSPEDVVVTAGAQQAFDLLARLLVASGRKVIAVEDPSYPLMLAAFRAAGADPVGAPVDHAGLIVGSIPGEASIICVTPSHQFPLGITMTAARRRALLDLVECRDALVIEDDYDCEFRFDNRPLDALQTLSPQRICYVGTFSKTMFPLLRLGFAIVPRSLRPALIETRRVADRYISPAVQLALASFISEGHLQRHVRRMQRIYAARRECLIDAFARSFGADAEVLPAGAGLHLAVRLRGRTQGDELLQRAALHGVGFESVARYALRSSYPDTYAFSFALVPEAKVAPAIATLARLVRS